MKKRNLKKKMTHNYQAPWGKKVIFFYLLNFEPEAKLQSNDRGNGFKLSAIMV